MNDEQTSGGLSPAAWFVFVAPDSIGTWRLRKSLALDNARWYFEHNRMAECAQLVSAARGAHHQVMRILRFLRTGKRDLDPVQLHRPQVTEPVVPEEARARTAKVAPRMRGATPRKAANGKHLASREMEVVRLVGQKLTNPQIAQRLQLSVPTTAAYVCIVRKKLGLADRAALTQYAIERGL